MYLNFEYVDVVVREPEDIHVRWINNIGHTLIRELVFEQEEPEEVEHQMERCIRTDYIDLISEQVHKPRQEIIEMLKETNCDILDTMINLGA